jgi:hypothetical protein
LFNEHVSRVVSEWKSEKVKRSSRSRFVPSAISFGRALIGCRKVYRMAYNPNRPPSGPHRSTPLIARPSSNSHQNQLPLRPTAAGVPQSYLGNMMGGALAGMGYSAPQQTPYNYPPQAMQPNYPYYPPTAITQQQYQQYPTQQHNMHYSQHYPQQQQQQYPYPSTSNSSFPPNPPFSSLPSRPSHSALPPTQPASAPLNSTPHSRTPKPPQPTRQTEFACKLEGCNFVSKNRRTTREHEEDRHLIFEPGREPKPWSGSLKPLDG